MGHKCGHVAMAITPHIVLTPGHVTLNKSGYTSVFWELKTTLFSMSFTLILTPFSHEIKDISRFKSTPFSLKEGVASNVHFFH